MAYFKQYGQHLASGFVQLTNGSPGPTTVLTAPSDEWTDVYSVVITTNDTALQTVTLDDGTNTINVYYVGGAGAAGATLVILDLGSVPFRTKVKGATIRVTAGAVTSGKTINVKVNALTSKT